MPLGRLVAGFAVAGHKLVTRYRVPLINVDAERRYLHVGNCFMMLYIQVITQVVVQYGWIFLRHRTLTTAIKSVVEPCNILYFRTPKSYIFTRYLARCVINTRTFHRAPVFSSQQNINSSKQNWLISSSDCIMLISSNNLTRENRIQEWTLLDKSECSKCR